MRPFGSHDVEVHVDIAAGSIRVGTTGIDDDVQHDLLLLRGDKRGALLFRCFRLFFSQIAWLDFGRKRTV